MNQSIPHQRAILQNLEGKLIQRFAGMDIGER
jgi:hypothetical protein